MAAIVSGGAMTTFGPSVPWMYVRSALFAIGSGLLYTLEVESFAGYWIGFETLAGAGAGAGVGLIGLIGLSIQVPYLVAQMVLPPEAMLSGNALLICCNSIGGAICVFVG